MVHTHSIVLLVFLFMFISVLCVELKRLTKIPASVLIFLSGNIFSLIGQHIPEIDETIKIVESIGMDSIMFVFLPALIFEASTKIDWYTFKNELSQIIFLATTVVVFSSILNAAAIKYIIRVDFSFSEALLLGVILSATDHVAVCAQLREAHARRRLETLILGETLLNEVVIVLFFSLLMGIIQEESSSEVCLYILPFVFRLSLGGILFGLICAVFLGLFLAKIINDPVQEVSLVLSVLYLVFYVADGTILHVSGAFAIVTIGLYMAAYGKTLISHSCEQIYHGFWKIVGFNTEAIVFSITGVILVKIFSEKSTEWVDLGLSFILFILLYIVRGIVLMLHFPLLRRIGYKITLKEIGFLAISGTKGAVSLALALTAYRESGSFFSNESVNTDILFYTSTVSALTVVFGTFLVKFSVKWLDLKCMTDVQENMMISIALTVADKTEEKIAEMKRQEEFRLTNWYKVYQIAGPKNLANFIIKLTEFGRKFLNQQWEESGAEILENFRRQLNPTNYKEIVRRYLGALKKAYWHMNESGSCLKQSVVILITAVDQAMDGKESLNDWEFVRKEICESKFLKLLSCLSKIPLIGKSFTQRIFNELSISYDLCRAFIEGHLEALKTLKDKMLIEENLFENLKLTVKVHVNECQDYLNQYIINKYPDNIEGVTSSIASHKLLKFQMNQISDLHNDGLIEDLEFMRMKDSLDAGLKLLSYNERPRIPSLRSLLRKRFPDLDTEELNWLIRNITEKNIQPNEVIFSEGSGISDAYLILQGGVQEWARSNWIDYDLSIGNIVGIQNLLLDVEVNTTTAKTLNMVRVAILKRNILQDEKIMEQLYREASKEILLFYQREFGLDCSGQIINKMCKHCSVERLCGGNRISNKNGFFVLHGKVGDFNEHQFCFPDDRSHRAERDSIIMIMTEKIGQSIRRYGNLNDGLRQCYTRKTSNAGLYSDELRMELLEQRASNIFS